MNEQPEVIDATLKLVAEAADTYLYDWRDLDSYTIKEIALRAYSAAKVAIELNLPIPPVGSHSATWILAPAYGGEPPEGSVMNR